MASNSSTSAAKPKTCDCGDWFPTRAQLKLVLTAIPLKNNKALNEDKITIRRLNSTNYIKCTSSCKTKRDFIDLILARVFGHDPNDEAISEECQLEIKNRLKNIAPCYRISNLTIPELAKHGNRKALKVIQDFHKIDQSMMETASAVASSTSASNFNINNNKKKINHLLAPPAAGSPTHKKTKYNPFPVDNSTDLQALLETINDNFMNAVKKLNQSSGAEFDILRKIEIITNNINALGETADDLEVKSRLIKKRSDLLKELETGKPV